MDPGLLRAVLIVSGLAAAGAVSLSAGLGAGSTALTALGVILVGAAAVGLGRVARFVLASGRPRR